MDTISSDIGIKNIKLPVKGRVEYRDKQLSGLILRASPRGKAWFLYTRLPGSSKPTRIKMATYGVASESLTLKQARQKADDWKEMIKGGDDPREALRDKDRRKQDTFDVMVKQFLKSHGRKIKASTKKQYESILSGKDLARIIKKPVSSITRQQVIRIVDDIADSGRLVQANRTLAVMKKFFGWCAEKDIIRANEALPTDRIKPAAKEKPRARILSPEELRIVWLASDSLGWPFGDHFKLMITTAQRQSEAASISRESVSGGVWRQIDNKAGREHLLPLNDLSVAILESVPGIPETKNYYLSTTGKSPISGFSKAKRRLDGEIKKVCKEEELDLFNEPWRTHDIRRTATTIMRALGVSQDVCSRILNHAQKGVTGKVYDVYDMLPEKTRALQVWNNYLEKLINGEADNVVDFRKMGNDIGVNHGR